MSDSAKAIEADLAAFSMVAWYATESEVRDVTAEEFTERLTAEIESFELWKLVPALVGHGAFLLRLLAMARGVGLNELVAELAATGALAHFDLEIE